MICSGDILMAREAQPRLLVGLGVIKDRHGTWIVRKKVPKHLREPVARVFDTANGKQQRTWLQKSTGTKLKAEAMRLAPAILGGVCHNAARGRGVAGRASTADNADTARDRSAC